MAIAFYLRLSIADGDLGNNGKDESNSIENQRHLLENYVMQHRELQGDVFEYIDDGYTGTKFDRPSFLRMIEDAKKKKFHTILVKDLSRLGKERQIIGKYVLNYKNSPKTSYLNRWRAVINGLTNIDDPAPLIPAVQSHLIVPKNLCRINDFSTYKEVNEIFEKCEEVREEQ